MKGYILCCIGMFIAVACFIHWPVVMLTIGMIGTPVVIAAGILLVAALVVIRIAL